MHSTVYLDGMYSILHTFMCVSLFYVREICVFGERESPHWGPSGKDDQRRLIMRVEDILQYICEGGFIHGAVYLPALSLRFCYGDYKKSQVLPSVSLHSTSRPTLQMFITGGKVITTDQNVRETRYHLTRHLPKEQ